MRTELSRITFFSKKQFKDLKLPKLDYKTYKSFIREYNELKAKALLEKKEGVYLPLNFGRLQIVKKKPKKDLYTTHSIVTKKGKEFNQHSFGYIYSIDWSCPNSFVIAKGVFAKKIKTFMTAYRFKAHRQNIKRPLAQIIKNQIRDYEKLY